jgi:antitoxin (DNA-binding transcriptional repressor) of toxin-antitoxin stability system
MKTIEITDANACDRAVAEGQHEDVVVFRGGKPVALITPFNADDLVTYADEHDPGFIASIARARAQAAAGQGMTAEELLRELDARDAAGHGDAGR